MKKINTHWIFIAALAILSLFYFNSILHKDAILNNIHYINDLTFLSYNTKEALSSSQLPLWTPYFYSGQPLLGIAENYMFDMNFLMIYLFRNIYFAMNFSLIFYFLLSGISMYFLVYNLLESKKAAFVSALIYMLNGFMASFMIHGNINLIEGYALIPLIFLFVNRALKGKNWIACSILAGLLFALQILSGSMIFFFYTCLIIAFYFAVNIFTKKIASVLIKSVLVGIIIVAVALSIASIKLLPVLEFTKLSSRSVNVSMAEFLGAPVSIANIAGILATDLGYGGISAAVGIAGFILVICGLMNYRKKIVIFCFVLVIFSLLFASDTVVAGLMYKVPGFDRLRHVERALILSAFACSILAGYGFAMLSELLSKKYLFAKYRNVFFGIAVAFVLFELLLLHQVPLSEKIVQPDEIGALEFMGRDNSTFRTVNLALNDVIGAAGYNYYAQKGISEVKGGGGIWINDYANYVGIAQQNMNTKMLGILNVKYLVAGKKMNEKNITLVKRFDACQECAVWNAFGPYLYENKDFLPRYYIAPNAVLVAGNSQAVSGLIYNMMFQNWNQGSLVIIEGTKINDYSIDFLKKFKGIILAQGSVDDASVPVLHEYDLAGGTIMPDIFRNRNTLSNSDVDKFFNKTSGNYTEIKIKKYSGSKVVLELSGQKGWLAASERFAYFTGWSASVNGKKIEMVKADNGITALYLDGESGDLVFDYSPDSYTRGKWISLAALILIFSYFAYFAYSKINSRIKGGHHQD